MTVISVENLRRAAGITHVILPSHMESDTVWDKWGNPILPSNQRLRGELFFDPQVQKILERGGVLSLFTNRVKYPRTFHLPWSDGVQGDDVILSDVSYFEGKRVIVTVKMDGENSTLYRDYFHARSIDGASHPSQSWIRRLHSEIAYDIPADWRVCGENLYAKHSIGYHNLHSYFQVFSVWNERNEALSWDDTVEWAELLGLPTVPVLYDGVWDEGLIQSLYQPTYEGNEMEGYVVRIAEGFPYSTFRRSVAKYVRTDHVRTQNHWRNMQVISNGLKER
jgi:hypothetical protein